MSERSSDRDPGGSRAPLAEPVVSGASALDDCAALDALDGLDGEGTLAAVEGLRRAELAAGARRLALVCRWVDLNGPESVRAEEARRAAAGVPWSVIEKSRERLVAAGGDGTPRVAEFAADELGCALHTSTAAAGYVVADAMDLRHRHPRLWALVQELVVPAWTACQVVRRTRAAGLSLEQARWVDARTARRLPGLTQGRAVGLVDAAIIAADPEAAEERRQAQTRRRYASLGPSEDCDIEGRTGLRTFTARTWVGEVRRFDAMITRLAQILAENGDTDPVDVRRAKAFTILATPAFACRLLADAARAARHRAHRAHRAERAERAEAFEAPDSDAADTEAADPRVEPFDGAQEPPVEPLGETVSEPPAAWAGSPLTSDSVPEPDLELHPDPDPETWYEPVLVGEPRSAPEPERPPEPHPERERDPVPPDQSDPDPEPVPPDEMSAVTAAAAVGDWLAGVDLACLLPPAMLYLHLTDTTVHTGQGVGRVEDTDVPGGGFATTLAGVTELLGGCQVTIRPVLDQDGISPVDGYEHTPLMREAVALRSPVEVFPHGTTPTRRADLDHSRPYVPVSRGGPPGQTHPDNVGPLGRHHHRLRTHARGWRHYQPLPGLYYWRTPHGRWYAVDHTGTHDLGTTTPLLVAQLTQQPATTPVERRLADTIVEWIGDAG